MARMPIVIDCDPGMDDAIALLLALASPEALDLRGVTTVAGNVPVDRCTENALRVLELADRTDVPVHAGCPRPLLRPLVTARDVHGEDGLGGADLPPPATAAAPRHGVDLLLSTLGGSTEGAPATLCATGPLTNLAVALVRDPDVFRRAARIVLMGGALGPGNVTPSAEFNFHVDPHAARIVLGGGVPVTMIGLDATRRARATAPRIAALEAVGTRAGSFVADLLGCSAAARRAEGKAPAPPVHDLLVPAFLLRPDLFATRTARVSVIDWGETDAGRVVEDPGGVEVTLVTGVDADGLFGLLAERLARLP